MSLRRGIEPIIATVILVAVALIIAVAVVGYLMGLFGGLAGGSPQISITSVRATIDATTNTIQFELYVNNAGAGSDKLTRVEVLAGGKATSTSGADAFVSGDGDIRKSDNAVVVPANYRGWVTLTINAPTNVSVSPGDTVILRLYFERSGVQTINVVISPS